MRICRNGRSCRILTIVSMVFDGIGWIPVTVRLGLAFWGKSLSLHFGSGVCKGGGKRLRLVSFSSGVHVATT